MKNGISQLYQTGEMEWCKNPKRCKKCSFRPENYVKSIDSCFFITTLIFKVPFYPPPQMLFLSLALEPKMVSAVFLK